MYISVMFVSYMAAAFIALLGIAIALLIISKGENRDSKEYRTVTCFALIVFAECLLYFYFYFEDMILKQYAVNVVLRIIDYGLIGGIFFFWMRVMDSIGISHMKRLGLWSWIIGLLFAGTGIISTAFFMDEYYCFTSHTAGVVYTYIESGIVLLAVVVITLYTLSFVRASVSRFRRFYAILVSTVLLLWNIQQIFVDSSLYLGIYKSAWASGVIDTTGLAMFLTGLATFVFMFREDFSPLYYAKAPQPQEGETNPALDPLEQAAEQHHLTVRELDVLRLVYEGKNNPEIAEELFISINTVKKHMKNIYEKTGTSSRMELAYLINRKDQKE